MDKSSSEGAGCEKLKEYSEFEIKYVRQKCRIVETVKVMPLSLACACKLQQRSIKVTT